MAGYLTFWSKEHVRTLERAGDRGPLSVIYGGPHTKMPSLAAVRPGDILYPASIQDGTLCAMARLEVERIEPALEYLMREVGRPAGALVPQGMALERTGRGGENLLDGRALDFSHSVFALSDGTRLERREELPAGLTIAIHGNNAEKGSEDGDCRARRRTQAGRRPSRTTTRPCDFRTAELFAVFSWIAIRSSPRHII